ncbi:PAS domain-containing hybrid sensor histidine kinase/response regulator [Rhodoferax saidenbachensis]|uniref:Sensory/regulatory protein RpfC n=1 Tax=Rhodoferax saidenbachensis TaxID=1484693 RepID=A0A1P8K957_9BURK|nr:PAS domain-containing hybrid sensor histidine kinase/response regulator [Rhodoferax saidenbachensis]APW42534.1 hybrid sensor histidine kinase/response regulator [Rhodoferax saidenbachensis]
MLTTSDQDNLAAVARGFNASLLWAVGLGLAIAAGLGLFSDWDNLIITGAVLLVMGGLQVFLVRGWVRATSLAMLLLLFFGIFYSMVRFGSVSIAQASLAGIPLIYCVVILGELAGATLLLVCVAGSAWITWSQVNGQLRPAAPTVPAAQWVVLTVGFVVAYCMAILFKRHLMDASRKLNATQALLLQERERSNTRVMETLAELERQKHVIDQHAIVVTISLASKITYGNQKFEQVSGYSPAEFLGNDFTKMRSGVHDDRFFQDIRTAVEDGAIWQGAVCLRAKDGRLFWLDSTLMTFRNADGTAREYIAVSTDVTQRRQAQEAAQAANRAKSQFLANMSHEIRTPMNGVVGTVDILRATALDAGQQRLVSTIHDSSVALLQILNDVLDFSKIESGKLEVESAATDLRELVEGVARLMDSIALAKGIALQIDWGTDVPRWIYTDPMRLRQVLYNLVGNALKFTPGDTGRAGQVTLRVAVLAVDDSAQGLEFRVVDNGIGMRPQDVESVFEAFTQADVSTARTFGGTGLGLSITQGLLRMMGGSIAMHSTLGQGSEVVVVLPLRLAPTPVVAPDCTDSLDVRNARAGGAVVGLDERRVLLAEDNATNREVIQAQLRLLGFDCDCAPDGVSALQLWRTGNYALLLTDCQMPGMDGFVLADSIRAAEDPKVHMPIIAVTANTQPADLQRCMDYGMDDTLAKPLRLQALGAMMAKWLPPLAPGPDNDRVWDTRILGQLLGEDTHLQDGVLHRFLVDTQQTLVQLDALQAAEDAPGLAALLHKMKSSARTVGALQLGDLCQTLESHAGTANWAALKPGLNAVPAAFTALSNRIQTSRGLPFI